MALGFIPARGGSKGIPKKNLVKVGNRTLLEIGISKLFEGGCDKVFVSTDSVEIADLAKKSGAIHILRPKEISGDTATSESAIRHFLTVQELNGDEIVVMHQITSPFLKASSIRACIEKLTVNRSLNSCLTALNRHTFVWERNKDLWWEPINHDRDNRLRRQDLPERCIESGGAYGFKVKAFNLQGTRYAKPTGIVEVEYLENFEIDSPSELSQAILIQAKLGDFFGA